MFQDDIAVADIGTNESIEEYEYLGDYREGKFQEEGVEDNCSIWIGKAVNGVCFIGVAGRNFVFVDGERYFRTAGLQEIPEEDYRKLIASRVFQKTK